MRVLVAGSGGREDALAWKIAQSPHTTATFCAPGNPGSARWSKSVSIKADDVEGLADFATSQKIDLTVIGPEVPLVAGVADRLEAVGCAVVGPRAGAAQLEGSKAFAKEFMTRYGIPTADYRIHDDAGEALRDLRSGRLGFPLVVKADGLAAGKGVYICQTETQGAEAIAEIMQERRFGAAGRRVVIEECLEGEEASFMIFSDGEHVISMIPAQDHKAVYEDDRGPNTGGMGAYSWQPLLTPELQRTILESIIRPTIVGMAESGHPYRGILYAGLMLTSTGPQVLEFNVRLGDPEAQVILPSLKSDLVEIGEAVARGNLERLSVTWQTGAVVCVVLASQEYPGPFEKGYEIQGIEAAEALPQTTVFHACTSLKKGQLVTSGGRVLGVTSRGNSLREAVDNCYQAVSRIRFQGMHYRKDIAAKGLSKLGDR